MWADVARTRLRKHVAALRAHEGGAQLGRDPEDVHQMRVATRRLRAGLRLLAGVLPPEAEGIRVELRWLAMVLGNVRDLDVQIDSLARAAADLSADPDSLGPVLHFFETRRCRARAALQDELASQRYTTLLGRLDHLLETPWPNAPKLTGVVVARLIRRRYRKLRETAAPLHASSCLEELHRARIRAKQLRYAVEFFADPYGKPARRLIRRSVRLQDLLGSVHDAAVLRERLVETTHPDQALSPENLFLIGQLDGMYAQRVRDAQARAPAACARLAGKSWKRLERRMRAVASAE